MDAIGVLSDQMAALAVGGNPTRHRPYAWEPQEEDEDLDGEEAENPFVVGALGGGRTGIGGYYQPRARGREIAADHRDVRQWESGLKIELPECQGCSTPEECRVSLQHRV